MAKSYLEKRRNRTDPNAWTCEANEDGRTKLWEICHAANAEKNHSPVTRNDGNGNLDRRIKKYSSMRHLPAEARDNCRMEGGVEGVAIGHR